MDLFVEKYRPRSIEDCILPSDLKNTFREMVKSGTPQNLLLCGPAGTGKTSVARALCNDMNAEYILINCSEEGSSYTIGLNLRSSSPITFGEDVCCSNNIGTATFRCIPPIEMQSIPIPLLSYITSYALYELP